MRRVNAMKGSSLAPAVAPVVLLAFGLGIAGVAGDGGASQQSALTTLDASRFAIVAVVHEGQLDEPMMFDVAADGRVFVAERKGGLKYFNPASGATTTVATIPVNHRYTETDLEAEEGFMGIALDPNFDRNGWLYTLTADPAEPRHVLSRWHFDGQQLVAASRVDLLAYPVHRRRCCHVGGGIEWDARGNLYVLAGSNTPEDESAVTPDDLRGKILRIRPTADGSYTIPPGNLFAPGTPGTRPEIYAMGVRNPWRLSSDSATGFVYWGEVGQAWDEFNQARGPAFFGWPLFEGDNAPQRRANMELDAKVQALAPRPAFIAYDSNVSEAHPLLGAGTRCAVGGPVYRRADFAPDARRVWPSFFDGKWLVTDCVRSWLLAVGVDDRGDLQSLEEVPLRYRWSTPLDLKFGPEGDLYVLEYGVNYFMRNENARLVRIEYHGGNRAPVVRASADRMGGAVPFGVTLSASGTADPDGQSSLTYRWSVAPASAEGQPRVFNEISPVVAFDTPGVYTATLTVSDEEGAAASESVTIVAGNAPPQISLAVSGIQGFYTDGKPFQYNVRVTDSEDNPVDSDRVVFGIEYVSEDFNVESIRTSSHQPVGPLARFAVATSLMSKATCAACHHLSVRTIGPSMAELAAKYQPTDEVLDHLTKRVRSGGTGVWGTDMAMPPHPGLTFDEAKTIVRAMLSVGDGRYRTLPLSGTFTPTVPPLESGFGDFLIHAAYTDGGGSGLPTLTSDAVLVLKSPWRTARRADVRRGVTGQIALGGIETGVAVAPGAVLGFNRLDLSGVTNISLWLGAIPMGGSAEVRLGSPSGPRVASTTIAPPSGRGGRGAGGTPGVRGVYGGIGGNQYDNVGAAAGVVARPPTVTLDVVPTTGIHDVYLVFENAAAGPADTLMVFNAMKFVVGE